MCLCVCVCALTVDVLGPVRCGGAAQLRHGPHQPGTGAHPQHRMVPRECTQALDPLSVCLHSSGVCTCLCVLVCVPSSLTPFPSRPPLPSPQAARDRGDLVECCRILQEVLDSLPARARVHIDKPRVRPLGPRRIEFTTKNRYV